MERDLITVIVPIYNVDRYLEKCVNSIITQSYGSLEIILVDDGSNDRCPQICNEYGEKDDRIVVIHQENAGQGKARNVGLDRSKGNFIAFLDADDYWEENYLELLYNKACDSDADIVICNYKHVDENGAVMNNGPKCNFDEKMYDGDEAMSVALYWREFGVAPWAKLFRRNVWDGIRFKEDRIYEDLATTYLVYHKASKVCFINKYLMSYRIRSNSDIHQAFNTKKVRILDSADEILEFCMNRAVNCVDAAKSRELATAFFILFQIPDKLYEEYDLEIDRCKQIIYRFRKTVAKDKKARRKTRMGAILSYLGFGIEKKIFILMNKIYYKR